MASFLFLIGLPVWHTRVLSAKKLLCKTYEKTHFVPRPRRPDFILKRELRDSSRRHHNHHHGKTAGPTPFISQLTLTASDTSVLESIQFAITPKPGSVTRPLSGTYSQDYMISRGYLVPPSTDIFLPVYGLYDGYDNDVTLTYNFLDGSSKTDSTTITTDAFDDQGCGFKNPTVLQARTDSTDLSYDYIFVRSGCGDFSPIILDTDGALRWVSTMGIPNAACRVLPLLQRGGLRDDRTHPESC